MALITCPECGSSISDKAKTCIHCGCPLQENSNEHEQLYTVVETDLVLVSNKIRTNLLRMKLYNDDFKEGAHGDNVLATGIPKYYADIVLDYLVTHKGDGKIIPDNESTQKNQTMIDYIDLNLNKNAPVMCPRCKSRDVVTTQRGFSLLTGFIGSNKTVNRCAKCGRTWEPKR